MILKAVSSNGVLVDKTFNENDYSSPSEFEQDVRVFIESWDKVGDPLSCVWKEEECECE